MSARVAGGFVCCAVFLIPASAAAVNYVKSVEYVEITLPPGVGTASKDLTKGQNVANCVPFASASVNGTDGTIQRAITDVYFQIGPARVTAERSNPQGTVSVGVFVVEFEPAFVSVQQGTFAVPGGSATAVLPITPVDLAKAALVSYYRFGGASIAFSSFAVAGWFSAANQLSWQRNTTVGPVNGHYYVFEARSNEFSVEAVSFSIANGSGSASAAVGMVDADKTLLIASYRTAYANDDNEDGQIAVFLANPTTITARRQFQNSGGNAITDIRAFVVHLGGVVNVQHGSIAYADTDSQKTVVIDPVNPEATMVWNGVATGPGMIESEATAFAEADTAFHGLKLADFSTIQGSRGEACPGPDCAGIGQYQVVDFSPLNPMRVRSGVYVGNGVAARTILVDFGSGFQPSVVFVKRDDVVPAVVRTSSMVGNLTKDLDATGVPLFADGILSLGPGSSFTLGSDVRVNAAGATYHWIAFSEGGSILELRWGSYTGNGADNWPISVGFQPEYVITLPANGAPPLHRSVTMTGDTSYDFDATELGPPANAIQAFELGGFQIGNSPAVNASTVTYHYIAWNFMPGRIFMGTYLGDGLDPRPLDVVGFMPEWLLVKRQGDLDSWVHKPASTGVNTDSSLHFSALAGTVDAVQALRPLGFEVGGSTRVNAAPNTYHWIAFGPHPAETRYRSIGAASAYGTGSAGVSSGGTVVGGAGTFWKTANRGRGDVITIPCDDPPSCTGGVHYTVASVGAEDGLVLTDPYAGASAASVSYLIRRQFVTLQDWEDCIDGPPGTPCFFFPVPSDSLVADNRAEVGIAYKDGPLAAGLVIDGRLDNANTDADHTITLTADRDNRHHGKAGLGVVVDNGAIAAPAIQVLDNFVTVEWIEVKGGGAAAHAIQVDGLSAGPNANHIVLTNNLIHSAGGNGIGIDDPDTILDAHNNIVYANAQRGIQISPMPLTADSRIRLRNNTVFGNASGGIAALDASNPTLTLQNDLAHGNTGGDFAVPALDPGSRNNLASDATAVAHSPAGGGLNSVSLASIAFVSTTPGSEDLHIQTGSAAENTGADLDAFLHEDIDEERRNPIWEIGADDTGLPSGSCSLVTTSQGGTTISVETAEVRMVWDAGPNAGGGLNELYGKTEANPALNRSGDVGGYNVFATNVNDGTWFFEGNGQPGSIQALEVSPVRVRLRQRHDYTASIHLARDWTVSSFPRLALDETLTLDVGQSIRGATGLHPKGELACGGANTFFCGGNASEIHGVFVVTDDAASYSDMLAFAYTAPFFGRSGAGPAWEALFEAGTPNTYFGRVREVLPIATAAGSVRRAYLLYPYLAGLASTGVGWNPLVTDYRQPDLLTINAGAGAPWLDAAENTGAGDFFNEAENAYLLEFQPALGLDFDIDGGIPRRKPLLKIRRWPSTQLPGSVRLEGVPLLAGTDYRAALKPVARAHVCSPGCNQLAMGGLTSDANEFLNDAAPAKNAVLSLVGANLFYVGSDSRFRGLNVLLEVPGAGSATLQWEYWNGAAWTSLTGVGGFSDTTNHLTRNGSISWTADPPGWSATSVGGGPMLYYVRAFVSAGAYTTLPKEALVRTDILLFQYCASITANAQTFDFEPLASADLAITKTDGQTNAVPSDPVSYAITVTNNGPSTLTSLFVNDALPAEITGASFTPSTGVYNDVTGEWTGLNLAPTESVVLTLSGTIDPFARGALVNTASVQPPAGFSDPNGANDFASDSDTLDASADVQVVKVGDVASVQLGALLTYTLTITNNGPSGATNVMVSDPLPPGMTLDTAPLAIVPSQGTCNYDFPTRTVDCSLGSIGPTLFATVTIKVRPGATGTFTNTATTFRTEPDSMPANDAESETTTVEVSNLGVRVLTATSTSQQNVLEWINPTDADYVSTEIVVRGDRFPTGPGDGATIYLSGAGGSGGRVKFTHATGALSNGMTFHYGAFVHRAVVPLLSPGRFCSGRPFDHAPGPVKWAFATGATALAAPTVGGAGVIATSNDKLLYSMERGPIAPGGEWPASFEPVDVGGPVQLRSPVVPVTVSGANPVVYVGSQDGSIYTIDAAAGGSVPYLWVTPIGPMVQAAPAGIFGAFGGSLDYILVGTRDSSGPNAFVALDPYSGVEIDRWDNGGAGVGEIGIVNGMAVVDQFAAPPRVYFTNYERTPVGSTLTLRCFELSSTPPVFNQIWARALGDIDSSPVLRNGRVYVGSPTGGGTVYSIDALDGNNTLLDRTFVHGDGQVKGFVFPDRASNDVYFATDDFVWGVTDNAGGMVNKFAAGISLGAAVKPSPVLFVPGSHYVYVGGTDGKLYELDTLGAPGVKSVTLGNGLAAVGAPSLDRIYSLIHVGTEAGIFYAVQVPLP